MQIQFCSFLAKRHLVNVLLHFSSTLLLVSSLPAFPWGLRWQQLEIKPPHFTVFHRIHHFAWWSPNRRIASGGEGGALPPRFSFLPPLPPPDLFLAPHGNFWGGKSCSFWPEKTFEFVISARKSLRISAKTFIFYFLEITWFSLKLRLNPI